MFKTLSYKTGLFITILVLVAGCSAPKSPSPSPTNIFQSKPNPVDERNTSLSVPERLRKQKEQVVQKSSSNLRQQQREIDNAIDKLLVGQAFHNVPNEMKVGATYKIEAGIAAQQISKNQILKLLQGEGKPQIVPNVRYDPTGIKMDLLVNYDQFKVYPFSNGEQLVSSKEPAKWIWEVTPLSSGKHHLTLVASVNLEIPETHKSVTHKFIVLEENIPVQINFQYSLLHFITSNWKEVISLIFGSGSLAAAIGWFLAKRHEKLKKTDKDAESL